LKKRSLSISIVRSFRLHGLIETEVSFPFKHSVDRMMLEGRNGFTVPLFYNNNLLICARVATILPAIVVPVSVLCRVEWTYVNFAVGGSKGFCTRTFSYIDERWIIVNAHSDKMYG
jgi:hypothetical protein